MRTSTISGPIENFDYHFCTDMIIVKYEVINHIRGSAEIMITLSLINY